MAICIHLKDMVHQDPAFAKALRGTLVSGGQPNLAWVNRWDQGRGRAGVDSVRRGLHSEGFRARRQPWPTAQTPPSPAPLQERIHREGP